MSEEREQRNQVFTGPAAPTGVDPRIPTTTAADKARADFGLEILPAELVPLPSAGAVYPANSPLHKCEVVEIKAMTAREEDILTNTAFMKKGTIITELIKSCLINKSVNPLDLLTGDRNALMVAIRITGYTADYEVEVTCNECGAKSPRTFDLGELPIKRLEISPVSPGLNLFEFVLPACKKTVRFKFLTGRDEEEIMATSAKQKKLGINTETTVTTGLLYSIVSIDGVEDRSKIANFVRMMPARDSLALRNYISTSEPGITMKQELTCPTCDHTEEVNMPMGISFLWPSAG
jgi:hypothetical protein